MASSLSRLIQRITPGTNKAANTDFFTSDITPARSCTMRLSIAVAQASVVSIRTSAYKLKLNTASALTADTLYTFEFQAHPLDAFNIQQSISCQVLYCNLSYANE